MSVFDVESPIDEKILSEFGFEKQYNDGRLIYIKQFHLYALLIINPGTFDVSFTYMENGSHEIKVLKVGHINDRIDLECIINKFYKISWGKN